MELFRAHSVRTLSPPADSAGCAPRARAKEPVTLPYTFTPALRREMEPLYERVKHVVTPMEWVHYAPIVKAINELKVKRNAVILAHNYMTPEIFHCVGDFKGDSLQLAKEAARTKADVIVQAGVHFMAETSKLLSPDKTVLIPDPLAGCSLASSITPEDVRALRAAYPGVPIVTYVNTSAAVKAECDITCTSSNAVKIVESLGVPRVLLIPDQYLAKYVQTKTDVEIIAWNGACEVHERFTGEEMAAMREAEPGLKIIAHPECPPDVINAADFTGSTAAMIDWVKTKRPAKVVLVTECSMASNVAAETPDVEFVRPCNLCPHMKRISLEKIYEALLYNRYEVTVDPIVAEKARRAVERMVEASA
jgi:quinolinate synthase